MVGRERKFKRGGLEEEGMSERQSMLLIGWIRRESVCAWLH